MSPLFIVFAVAAYLIFIFSVDYFKRFSPKADLIVSSVLNALMLAFFISILIRHFTFPMLVILCIFMVSSGVGIIKKYRIYKSSTIQYPPVN